MPGEHVVTNPNCHVRIRSWPLAWHCTSAFSFREAMACLLLNWRHSSSSSKPGPTQLYDRRPVETDYILPSGLTHTSSAHQPINLGFTASAVGAFLCNSQDC